MPDPTVLPRLHAHLPQLSGRIKAEPDDFLVEETPAYAPCGQGEHLFLWIEKRDVAANELTARLAEALNIPSTAIGTAGLKDRRAVSRQFVSVPASAESRLPDVEADDLHVLSVARHTNKLKTGHLRGNRFTIRVRGVGSSHRELVAQWDAQLRTATFSNHFGPQRFGGDLETLYLGLALLRGERHERRYPQIQWKRMMRLGLSAAQSAVFNTLVAKRITDGTLTRLCDGDVARKLPAGASFLVEDAARERPRFDAREIVPTGPIHGPKMIRPAGQVAQWEIQALQAWNLEEQQFNKYRKLTSGTRRPLLVWPQEASFTLVGDETILSMWLPAGSYATSLLAEIFTGQNHSDGDDSDDDA